MNARLENVEFVMNFWKDAMIKTSNLEDYEICKSLYLAAKTILEGESK